MIAGFISFVRLVSFSSKISVYCITDCNSLFTLSTWKVKASFEGQLFSHCPSLCIFTSGSLSFCLSFLMMLLFFILPAFYHITCYMPALILLNGNVNLITLVEEKFVGVVKRLRNPGSNVSSSSTTYLVV